MTTRVSTALSSYALVAADSLLRSSLAGAAAMYSFRIDATTRSSYPNVPTPVLTQSLPPAAKLHTGMGTFHRACLDRWSLDHASYQRCPLRSAERCSSPSLGTGTPVPPPPPFNRLQQVG